MADSLVERLLATRPGYESERVQHRLQLDSYLGTGGFGGKPRHEASGYWGAAAEVYSQGNAATLLDLRQETDLDTYLDRFPREDMPKFQRRVEASHYENVVAPVVDIPLSYLFRKEFKREGLTDSLTTWLDEVDAEGNRWDYVMREVVALRAVVLGYCPVGYDTDDEGIVRMVPMLPAQVLDWRVGRGGRLSWAKVTRVFEDRETWDAKPAMRQVVTVWYEDRWERFELSQADNAGEWTVSMREEGRHDFGAVPLETLTYRPVQGERVRGVSLLHHVSSTAKRLFNYQSELDEHIRQCVFAMLQVATKDGKIDPSLTSGSGNAIPIAGDSNRDHKWLSPPPDVAATLETRIKNAREAIFRQGRVEFTNGTNAGGARSGLSRAFEFETTNRAIADFAGRIARFEERSLRLVYRMQPGATEDGEREIRVVPPTRFAVQEMSQDLVDAEAAIALPIGPTATTELMKRVVRDMLPNLDADTYDQIASEIEQQLAEREQAASAARAELAAMGAAQDEPDDDDEEDEDEPDEGGDEAA
ncbi:MAG: hypothetical protein H6720_23770 [Sandaracinus sp.]|nr:hypothetical protein [Sandaracinus sp.]